MVCLFVAHLLWELNETLQHCAKTAYMVCADVVGLGHSVGKRDEHEAILERATAYLDNFLCASAYPYYLACAEAALVHEPMPAHLREQMVQCARTQRGNGTLPRQACWK